MVNAKLPSVAHPEPEDYLAAMQIIKYIPPYTPLKILGTMIARKKRWIETDWGFLNEIALYGKEVQIEETIS